MTKFNPFAFTLILLIVSSTLHAQLLDVIEQRFAEQNKAFPMEKIHVQTDKSSYLSGEDIWFRIFLVNALSLRPDTSSRYVYAELINPEKEVAGRVKIRPEAGAYHGHITLPEDIAAGIYQLRFYTRFMETQGEEYFFRKKITIGDPPSLKVLEEFIPAETEDNDDFDVAFFPEGGEFPSGIHHKIAFKSLNTKGLGENISGVVLNSVNDTLQTFRSEHLGMGAFMFLPKPGGKYYAVCKNDKGFAKRFELPASKDSVLSLNINNIKDRVNISVVHSGEYEIPDELYIVAHCRGHLLFSLQWNNNQKFITLYKKELPSGIIQILLADAQLNPISERLVFVINPKDEANFSFSFDKPQYKTREAVSIQIQLHSDENQLSTGNFSVSVTDDNDLLPDTTVNILSTLLLTSELKGYIEDPAYYFRNDNKATSYHLDILMMTQGWRKYEPASVLKGDIQYPKGVLELGTTISGSIYGGFLLTTPAKEYPVSIISLQEGIFGRNKSDNKGRFVFNVPELPDSTRFVVQANTPKGGSRVELLLDSVAYPPVRFLQPVTSADYNGLFSDYFEKADQKYLQEHGMRTVDLDELVVTAKRRNAGKGKSQYSSSFNTVVTSEKIAEMRAHSIYDILMRIPGVTVIGKNVSIRNQGTPLLLVDDFEMQMDDLDRFMVEDLDEVEIVKDAQAAIFGSRGHNGAILLTTKRGFDQTLRRMEKFNIKPIMPLGYQTPIEFYSPKYETQEELKSSIADLRTTIYWNPSIEFIDGKAQFTFYTSDNHATSYSIITEGISDDGRLICEREEILIE
jgi:hypothetical protein